jgi:hypothetical protein
MIRLLKQLFRRKPKTAKKSASVPMLRLYLTTYNAKKGVTKR